MDRSGSVFGFRAVEIVEVRRTADLYGLSKTGTVGVLIRAKQERHIESLKAELDRLLNQGGFWIEERLYKRVLKAMGES